MIDRPLNPMLCHPFDRDASAKTPSIIPNPRHFARNPPDMIVEELPTNRCITATWDDNDQTHLYSPGIAGGVSDCCILSRDWYNRLLRQVIKGR